MDQNDGAGGVGAPSSPGNGSHCTPDIASPSGTVASTARDARDGEGHASVWDCMAERWLPPRDSASLLTPRPNGVAPLKSWFLPGSGAPSAANSPSSPRKRTRCWLALTTVAAAGAFSSGANAAIPPASHVTMLMTFCAGSDCREVLAPVDVSMGECLFAGQRIAAEWQSQHLAYLGRRLANWRCVIGKRGAAA